MLRYVRDVRGQDTEKSELGKTTRKVAGDERRSETIKNKWVVG